MAKKAKKAKIAVSRKKIAKGKTVKKAGKAKKNDELDKSLAELVERGRPKGFVTNIEIIDHFPKIENNIDFLEEVYPDYFVILLRKKMAQLFLVIM